MLICLFCYSMFISKFISLKNKIYKEKKIQKISDDEEDEEYYCICCFEPYSDSKAKEKLIQCLECKT